MSPNPSNTGDFKIVIPARFASSRFPGKPLAQLCGKPMLWHVYRRAMEVGASDVVIATDHAVIADVAEEFGAQVCMTSEACPSGTDRIAEVSAMKNWADDTVIVNLQGDEPLTPASVIRQVADNLQRVKDAGIATLCSRIESLDDFHNQNVVKVVFDTNGKALYFSRSPIPFPRDSQDKSPPDAWRHIGIYAYRADFLKRWSAMQEGELELLEKLEQLRAMQNGVMIHVEIATEVPPHGVDTPEQLHELEALMDCANL